MRINVRNEINFVRSRVKRFRVKLALYGRNRTLGWGVRESWVGAEAEIAAAEWATVREMAAAFIFRLEVERDLDSLQVSE